MAWKALSVLPSLAGVPDGILLPVSAFLWQGNGFAFSCGTEVIKLKLLRVHKATELRHRPQSLGCWPTFPLDVTFPAPAQCWQQGKRRGFS